VTGDMRARSVERLADALRSEILGGLLIPGQPLREEELADRHGLSRHTVRAALAQLVGERLAVSQPYRGTRVTVFDDSQVVALQDLRRALESEAVRIVNARHDGGTWTELELQPIVAAIDRLEDLERAVPADWIEVERAHADVHLALVEAADSARISESYRALGAEVALLLLHTRPAYENRRLADEHRAFLREVQLRGPDAVRDHLAESTALLRDRGPRPPV
jgi:DNA-binding GntR family transcriptional regulator